MEIIKRNNLPMPEIFYVTRCYQTRHGAGFMTNEGLLKNFTPNPKETNQSHAWQGSFLNYAVACDFNYSHGCMHHFVVTCLDQIECGIHATQDGNAFTVADKFLNMRHYIERPINHTYHSTSECSEHLLKTAKIC